MWLSREPFTRRLFQKLDEQLFWGLSENIVFKPLEVEGLAARFQ